MPDQGYDGASKILLVSTITWTNMVACMLNGTQQASVIRSNSGQYCIVSVHCCLHVHVPVSITPSWHYCEPQRAIIDIVQSHLIISEVTSTYKEESKDVDNNFSLIFAQCPYG